jgi:hypothetical protein
MGKRLMRMASKGIIIGGGLKKTSVLYRYISLSQFLSMVERKKIHLTKVISWEDPWELPSLKIPTKRKDGGLEYPKHSRLKDIYGQCWSLNSKSDALWRIYSSRNNGILLHSTVERFLLLNDIKFGFLAPVIYYSNLRRALACIHEDDKYNSCYRFFGNLKIGITRAHIFCLLTANYPCYHQPPVFLLILFFKKGPLTSPHIF